MDQIVRHSKLKLQDSLYCGEDYHQLAKYLSQSQESRSRSGKSKGPSYGEPQNPSDSAKQQLHGTIYTYNGYRKTPFKQNLSSPRDASRALQSFQDFDGIAHIILLCGKPPPISLAGLGKVCRIDPEFLRRHLSIYAKSDDILRNRHTFREELRELTAFVPPLVDSVTLPSLPSTARNIVHLQYTSIGHFMHHSQLAVNASEISRSIVRWSTLHEGAQVSIDQQLSICVEHLPGTSDGQKSWLGESTVHKSQHQTKTRYRLHLDR